VEEAQGEVRAGLVLDPQFTIASFQSAAFSDDPTYLAQLEPIVEGLRRAGVPEQ